MVDNEVILKEATSLYLEVLKIKNLSYLKQFISFEAKQI